MPSSETHMQHSFRILGPLEVVFDGQPMVVTAPKQRIILATLLLRANEWVRTDDLIDAIWDDRSPDNPRASLQIHMARLRARFAGPATGAIGAITGEATPRQPISTGQGGYRFTVPPDSLDLHRYEAAIRRAREARQAGDIRAELDWITRALAEWRGDPLAMILSTRLQREVVTRLREDRLDWLDRRFELELALGRHSGIIGEIRTAALAHPHCERLWGHLLVALDRCGNRAAALDAYQQFRSRLHREFGVPPGRELRQLHERLLAEATPQRPLRASPPRPPGGLPPTARLGTGHGRRRTATVAPWHAQCQLPADIADFTGRAEALQDALTALRRSRHEALPTVICVTGAPGVGKTALALRVAHQLRTEFPDGQWHIRMSESDGTERRWPDVLTELLSTAGVEPAPADPRGAVQALRARLAGRHVLLVIDDVHEAHPLCDLLPLAPGCAVLTTHRRYPADLVTRANARVIALNVLSKTEASTLLARMMGRERAEADPAALDQLIERCDRLPLALRIAGAHLATHPQYGIAAFADRLRGDDPLTELALGVGSRAAVRTAFRLSYQALPPTTRRFFRLLAAVPGMSHTACTAAELAGAPVEDAAGALEELTQAHLIERDAGGYRFHSLLARFATERGRQEDDPAQLRAGLRRLGTHYLRLTEAAGRLCYPDVVRLPAPQHSGSPGAPPFATQRAAQTWLRRERRNLVAYIVFAVDTGLIAIAIHLTDQLRGYFNLDRRYADWLVAAQATADAVDAATDPRGAAIARLNLGLALQGTNHLDASGPHLRYTLAESQRLNAPDLELIAVNAVAMYQLQQPTKRFDESIRLLNRGLRLSRQLGLRDAQAHSLLFLGMARHACGDLRLARRHLTAALGIATGNPSCSVQSEILGRLGNVCCDLGDYRESARRLRAALRLGRQANSPYSVALALYGLARVYFHTGQSSRAHRQLARAMAIADRDAYEALQINARNVLAALYRVDGQPTRAEREHRAALREAERIGHPQGRCEALTGLAVLEVGRGRHTDARDLGEQALVAAVEAGSHRLQAQVRGVLAALAA